MRALSEIAREIRKDWGSKVHYAARPYLDAMAQLGCIGDTYYQDDARGIVLYFLNNASAWRGETAKRVKAELRDMVKTPKRVKVEGVQIDERAHYLTEC